MKKLYAPLAVRKSFYENMKTSMPKEAFGDGSMSFLDASINWVAQENVQEKEPLNIDDFLSWIFGPAFMKRSYKGAYSYVNESMLGLVHQSMDKGGKNTFREMRRSIMERMASVCVLSCWDRDRQSYRFDADFAAELMETGTADLPVTVLMRLPYRCFYLDTEDFKAMRSDGFFVYAGIDAGSLKPDIAILRVVDAKKDQPELQVSCLSSRAMEKCGLLQQNGRGEWCIRFSEDYKKGLAKEMQDEKGLEVFDHYLFILQAMLYLSSNNPDIMPRPGRRYAGQAPAKGRPQEKDVQEVQAGSIKPDEPAVQEVQAGSIKPDESAVADIGVRYGAAIRSTRHAAKQQLPEERAKAGTGKARKPRASHMRRAHWHHYWIGKGRTKLIVKWVPPTFVSGAGKVMPVTVHKVEK